MRGCLRNHGPLRAFADTPAESATVYKTGETPETTECFGPYTLLQRRHGQRLTGDSLLLVEFLLPLFRLGSLPQRSVASKSAACESVTCKSIIELGTGSGVLLLYLLWKTREAREAGKGMVRRGESMPGEPVPCDDPGAAVIKRLVGVELDPEAFSTAARNLALNGLDSLSNSGESVELIQGDWRGLKEVFPCGAFDIIFCNPPYVKAGSGRVSPFAGRALARAETAGTLRELVEISAYLAGPSGRVCYVYPEKRLADMLGALEENGLREVRLEYVHADRSGEPRRFLIEAARGDFSG